MYICNKCGEKIANPNSECPNCGLINNMDVSNDLESTKKFPVNIVVIVGAFLAVIFSVAFMQRGFSTMMVNFTGTNFSLDYDNIIWSEYSVNDELFALINNNDSATYLQIPVTAQELGMSLDSEENISTLYQTYVNVLRSSTELNYNNISSGFEILDGTNLYYITADFVSYKNEALKGKLYVLLSEEGKALNILVNLGSYNFMEIEDSVLTVLKTIDM